MEFTVALSMTDLLTAGLAAVFSSPDERPVTLARWARAAPGDFTATAVAELGRTSGTARYGPPYNDTPGAGQKIGPVSLQRAAGVAMPIETARDFVLRPLADAPEPLAVTTALATWHAASTARQRQWAGAYAHALGKAPGGDPGRVPPGDYGPVPALTARLLELALVDALHQTRARHLAGDQWGMMNERVNSPGQPWLVLYTLWCQIEPFRSSGNADVLLWGLRVLLRQAFVLVLFVPGVRSIPRWTGVYRLVWRDHYRAHRPDRSGE